MAILQRAYRGVGISPADISRYIAPAGALVLSDSGSFVVVQYNDALVDATTIDEVMAIRGYVFDATANVKGPLAPQIMLFFATGYFRTASGIDIQEPKLAFRAGFVVMRREIAGTAGTSEIDILVNGVSMFLPANRPKILFGAGNGARVSVIPDFPDVPALARVEMTIISAEAGEPQDLVAEITL